MQNASYPIRSGEVDCNGIQIHYQDEGDITAPPLLLIMGLGAQLTQWPDAMVQLLVEEGFRVIRFDNRDAGLSSAHNSNLKFYLPKEMLKARLGIPLKNNYTLHLMAKDTLALIDGLGLEKVHVVGASMGGMIAQLFAALFPHRCLSLTSIMSSTNSAALPMPRFDVMLFLGGIGVEKGHEKEVVLRRALKFWKKISSPHYPPSDEEILERVEAAFDRAYRPAGQLRQTHAILASGGFKHLLHRVNCPTQIIHGDKDPLVHPKGGKASAKAIPNAKLEMIEGMAHDFPAPLIPKIAKLISNNARTVH